MNTQAISESQKAPKKPFYKKWWVITISIFIFLSILIGDPDESMTDIENSETETQGTQDQKVVPQEQVQQKEIEKTSQEQKGDLQEQTQQDETAINYNIKYTVKDKRFDGGINYYVLIDPINLSNEEFKEDIKKLISKITKEKGLKISISFIDDSEVIDLIYKSHYGSNTLGRILNKSEVAQVEIHLIASFAGQLENNFYPNTLSFFPATFKDTPKVGKYLETLEYNPE